MSEDVDERSHRHAEVLQLYARFAHRIDDGDLAGWAELFARDAELLMYGQTYRGRDAIHEFMDRPRKPARHIIFNIECVIDGDRARVVADFEHVALNADAGSARVFGRYLSTLAWHDDRWEFFRHETRLLSDGNQGAST